MKVIIAGSRTITDYQKVKEIIDHCVKKYKIQLDMIVSGHAEGIDKLGERYAKEYAIDLAIFPANWQKHKKSAGPYRNCLMLDYVRTNGGLIAIRANNSVGTTHMIGVSKKAKLLVIECDVTIDENGKIIGYCPKS